MIAEVAVLKVDYTRQKNIEKVLITAYITTDIQKETQFFLC